MKWSGKQGYNDAPVQKWHSNFTGKHAGDVRTFQNLTFLRVFEAGHMVKFYSLTSIFKLFHSLHLRITCRFLTINLKTPWTFSTSG